jgi:NADH-quinone oxidoreductase subunit K
MSTLSFVFICGSILFILGGLGMVLRRNLLGILMFLELMLNGVNLSLAAAAAQHQNIHGAVLTFIIFIVAAAEMAIAIPIILLLLKQKKTLDVESYSELKG